MLDELPLDRPFLERLTTAELLKLADSLGIDVPPELDRTIVIEELLETGESLESSSGETGGDTGKESPLAEKPEGKSAQTTTAPLPQQYNITYIETLIRDPLWAFAFWEISAHDKETLEAAPDFGGYCLRVMAVNSGDRDASKDGLSFTVPIGTGDSAWYLGFPPEGGRYTVELCVMRKNKPIILTVSKPFRMPTLPDAAEAGDPTDGGAFVDNPLLRLAGIDDFNILRNTQRSSRLPKHIGLRE
jgi:hypothetical protein